MDNIAHALTGAALGGAGLRRLSGLAMPALMLSANLPDIDVFGVPFGGGLAWRRGWTHGPIATVILPALLALLIVAFDRWQARRGKRPEERQPVGLKPMLLLCYIGLASHLFLDLLNTYGIRLLMPFSDRWFYGDVLFIVDPLVWLMLGFGLWLSRRRRIAGKANFAHPALIALLGITFYIGAMYAGGRAAENIAAREFTASGFGVPERVLASPVLADPFRRAILVETSEGYRFGDLYWLPRPSVEFETANVPTNMDDPAIGRAAAKDKRIADFLYWSRFPFAVIERSECGTRVTINDGRFSRRPDSGPFNRSVQLEGEEDGTSSPAECSDLKDERKE